MKLRHLFVLLAPGTIAASITAQVEVVSSYSQSFDSLGTGLPEGWGVWLSSTATGNGTAFTWNTAQVANNASATATTYFRNLPGASQTWTSGLSAGADRALGWRAGNAASTDGSVTFSFTDTAGWSFDSMSFQLFTPNDASNPATIQFQYQIGSSGTFTNFSPNISYTTTTAQNPLNVTTISLSPDQLAVIGGLSDRVTLRLDNTAASGTTWETVALDNFAYTATASAIPEPSTYAAMAGGAALLGAMWQRRRRRASTVAPLSAN